MKHTTLNALVDSLSSALMLALGSTGLLMWLRLPPGSGHSATVLTLGRHDWGALHSWIAVALVATLAVHLALHLKWIVSVTAGQSPASRRRRLIVGALVLALAFAIAAVPLASPINQAVASENRAGPIAPRVSQPQLYGRTTLGEAAAILGVSPAALSQRLGLPPETPAETRLGQAARELGMTMEQLRGELGSGGSGR